jgi:hypothetical protein
LWVVLRAEICDIQESVLSATRSEMKKLTVPLNSALPAPPALTLRPERAAPQRMISCVICGSETQSGSPDEMCWVCRRLKISAWRDVEQQMPAQE